MPTPALLSRGLDPVLGIFTGCFAYYLHETHPRTAPPPDKRLAALVQWKWAKWKREREEKLNALEREVEASSRVVG
ncbi:hypothetical protein BDR03DRAFT_945173 [Suillus americanus]|nr:hypothetical protein BDR03DRAFT_945173 [Suillus americanus]